MQHRTVQVKPGPLVQRVRNLQLEQWMANVKTARPCWKENLEKLTHSSSRKNNIKLGVKEM